MIRSRSVLLACIPAALLGLVTAGTTAAEARMCMFKGMSQLAKPYAQSASYSQPARSRPAAKPMNAYAAVKLKQTAGKAASSQTRTAKSTKPAPFANPPVPPAPENDTSTCLSKEYLATGAVQFKDTCTGEWAINSTHLAKPARSTPGGNCLAKDNHQNGVVMFKDVCTNEWAMNTAAEQQARAQ